MSSTFPSFESGVSLDDDSLTPFQKFMYALRAPESKRQYPRRLQVFLDFLKLPGLTVEEKVSLFYGIVEQNGKNWLEGELIKFFVYQNDRAEKKEISTETIKNYLKPVKLFCEMNGIIINWKIISKGIKRGDRYSNDRPPTREEIKKLLEYPDRRIKPLVLTMISSGMRVGSWAHLKWGDITPIIENEVVIAAKIKIFNTKTNKHYFSFITSEAYEAAKEWMDFRQSFGEKISSESWIMRNLWQIKSQRYGNYLGLAKHPVQFSVDGIRMLINDAWKIQGVRDKPTNGNRYTFKSLHGFRKFFETECQKTMKSINISILMSHDTGIVQHYYKPQEQDLLWDYLKAIPSLTIDLDKKLLNKQIRDLEEKNKNNDWIIRGKLAEKDEQIRNIKEDAQNKEDVLSKVLKKIETLEIDLNKEKKWRNSFLASYGN